MQRLLVLLTVLIAAAGFGLIVGCDNSPSGPGGDIPKTVESIQLRVARATISGLAGEVVRDSITAIALNSQNVGISGIKISLGVQSPERWKGSISLVGADTSNEFGYLYAVWEATLEQSGPVTIEAKYGQVSAAQTINLSLPAVGQLTVTAERQVLSVPPNESKQTDVTATLLDTAGIAISGMQVAFRTNPSSLGYVENEAGVVGTTDNNGQVRRKFTSAVNRYGLCDVIAQVGDSLRDQVTIEIKQVAEPQHITAWPSVPVLQIARGQNVADSIYAVVTDKDGVGVESVPVEFTMRPFDEGGSIFGSIVRRDTTDAEGLISTVFRTLGGTGKLYIKARVLPSEINPIEETIESEFVLEVRNVGLLPRALSVRAFPNYINIPQDTIGASLIRATVVDQANNGIPNVVINFSANYGKLAPITSPTVTDSAGVALINYSILPAEDLPELVQTQVRVTATIPGTNFSAVAIIDVVPSRGLSGTLTLSANRTFIYADNGLTSANLTAVLGDEDGQALAGKDIVFTKSFPQSAVNSPVKTDSMGVARAVFQDIGVPSLDENGNPMPVLVRAKYNPMGLESQVEITILPQNPVDRIDLSAAARVMTAGRGDSTAVRAVAFLANGNTAPNGTVVNFEAVLGSFTNLVVPVSGNFGAAETYYIAGRQVGVDTLRSYVLVDTIPVYSNDVLVELISGPPSQIQVTANPRSLITNDPTRFSTITATVTDTAGNPVRQGTLVSFSTTLGSVVPNNITDETGRATARLTPGVQAGIAMITASVNAPSGTISGATTVTFISGQPNSITLVADPLEVEVRGSGGVVTSTLRATVSDPNGNVVEAPTTVVFELINEPPFPQGCKINNSNWDQGRKDSTTTANGVAVATLNAGEQIGGKLIRAYTWRDSMRTDTVSVMLSTIAVVSGPPFELDIDVNDAGNDAGGGAWVVEVSARVWDINRNPVRNGIPVVFTVDPQIATIDPGATGNVGVNGNPEPGLSYAPMYYNSVNTFDPLLISAEVQVRDGVISNSREHLLPLQEGNLELHVDPANWMFEAGNEDAIIRCWVVLKDGHEIEINNAPILFRSNRARFHWYNFARRRHEMYFPDPTRKYTGVQNENHNEERGQATVFLLAEMDDIFLDPFTLEVTVQIEARVEGYDDVIADPAFIFFTRRAG